MFAELKKDEVKLQEKNGHKLQENDSRISQSKELLSKNQSEISSCSVSQVSPSISREQVAMQFKDLSKNAELKQESSQLIQRKQNNTGLPFKLKAGIEHLSGYSMDDTKVHYNSNSPAKLQAHAFALGNQIHLAPGQEKHLPHEAWHVVQQKQGRVKPTMQLKGKTNINDDAGLEQEADIMGARASRMSLASVRLDGIARSKCIKKSSSSLVIQRANTETDYNSEAADKSKTGDFVHQHAEHLWVKVLELYKEGKLHHSEHPIKSASVEPFGMSALLEFRAKMTNKLLEETQQTALLEEKEKRKEIYQKHNLYEGANEDAVAFANEATAYEYSDAGSSTPTSDIDISLMGDGTEIAVILLNQRFRDKYGQGYESGDVYDVNFYAQSFITPNFGETIGRLEKEKPDISVRYTGNDWRRYHFQFDDFRAAYLYDQLKRAHVMMRTKSGDQTWDEYLTFTDRKNNEPEKAKRNSKNNPLNGLEYVHSFADKNHEYRKTIINKRMTDEGGSEIRAENREYEERLRNIQNRRVTIAMVDWQGRNKVGENHEKITLTHKELLQFDLARAISQGQKYANEAHYTEAALASTVFNKQAIDKMYKRQHRNDERGVPKLELGEFELYISLTENIGFCLEKLGKLKKVGDLISAGKYFHRMLNNVKHIIRKGHDIYAESIDFKSIQKNAANWEGIKHGLQREGGNINRRFLEVLPESDKYETLKQVVNTFRGVLNSTINGSSELFSEDTVDAPLKRAISEVVAVDLKHFVFDLKGRVDQAMAPLVEKKFQDFRKIRGYEQSLYNNAKGNKGGGFFSCLSGCFK